ncbi:MAG: trehalose/maltose transport system substrate-binding protein [Acidimicrobiaceae bacterium]|jgi:multiple sugar transport system substrate-binding protein|nr:trehalose/maltose transport system substrate-binding protein [Acidimicrobiaceae bacterium]MDQ1419010.1 trehalose/maltose transport system substrate-binding protein [Acidimicrobiaceae bacterium]MDQ1439920.1 trehalose/maltose transport system substrate-binding protein [Acidimicrobiaceae bacterium]
MTVLVGGLAACGSGGSGATTTLQWYGPPDSAGATDLIVKACNQQSKGAYRLVNNPLPSTADGQREQLVRRMAAKDSSVDLMTVDPPYTAELANAGWLQVFTPDERAQLLQGVLESPTKSAIWKGQLVAAPWEANTQLLWYDKSVAKAAGVDPTSPDFTWDQMIDAAVKTGKTVAEQGNRYEGYMVWVNALILSAGGSILTDNDKGRDAVPSLNSDAGKTAAQIIRKLATSKAADPALSSADEGASLATFEGPTGGFLLNWPYVYATIQANVKLGSVKKSVLDNLGWARYPEAVAGQPSAPPLGGGNVAISKFSKHQSAAFAALKCIISPEMEKQNILVSGNPIANGAVYDDAEVQKLFPMATLMRDSINAAGPRPVTPYYGDVSAAVQRDWHPEGSLDPNSAPAATSKLISNVLHDRRLL